MEAIAGWIAPAATIVAAMMTAANVGARITGWGFVVFTLGSVCWSIVGISTGQTNLIVSNGFLTLINVMGIWRWLFRQSRYADGAKSATAASRHPATPTLFTASGVAGMPVVDCAGKALGKAVEALIECATGEVSYVVVASGGLTEQLRAVPRDRVEFDSRQLRATLAEPEFARLPVLADGDWPAMADADAGRSSASDQPFTADMAR